MLRQSFLENGLVLKLKKTLIIPAVLYSAFSWSEGSGGCTQYDNVLSMVGYDYGEHIFVSFKSESPKSCNCSSVRFSKERTDTDKILAIVMAAKLANAKVRVDFELAGDCNSGKRAYIQ